MVVASQVPSMLPQNVDHLVQITVRMVAGWPPKCLPNSQQKPVRCIHEKLERKKEWGEKQIWKVCRSNEHFNV